MGKRISLPETYPLPANWNWVPMGDLVKMKTGFPFNSKRFSRDPTGRRPLIRIRDVLRGETETYTDEACPEEYIIHAGEILIGMDGDFNVSRWNSMDALLNQRVCWIESDSALLLNDFLFYYLPSPLKSINDTTPSITVKHLSTKTLAVTPFPLPPLPEQRRIVDRIESLFTKLDEARKKAQAVVDGYKYRRAAILRKAFTGELTAKWREKQGIGLDTWKETTVGEVCRDVKVGIVIKPSQYYTDELNGTPAFRSANVREGRIDNFDWVYLNEQGMKENKRSIVHTGDVLVVRSGNPGTACVVPSEFDGYNAIDILIAVPDSTHILSDYLCYYTNSPFGKIIVFGSKRGIALAHFNVKGYARAEIKVPKLEEQAMIIRSLDTILAKEQTVKESAETVLTTIDVMKKKILGMAFRGLLGTNDPAEARVSV